MTEEIPVTENLQDAVSDEPVSAGEAETWYLAICQGCTPVLPQPFTDESERDQWAERALDGHRSRSPARD